MTEKLILEKLEQMEKKVDKIEGAVSLIAVQTERINNISGQVNSLWAKYDTAFEPGGVVNQIKTFQAGCPRQTIKDTFSRQWVIIGLLATTVVGIALKAFVGS
jgi:uncharacterized protein YaaW (UPF0174 family)